METSRRASAWGVETRSEERVGSGGEDSERGTRSGRRFSRSEMCSSDVPAVERQYGRRNEESVPGGVSMMR